jgi:RHS repeat-associated protein
MISGTNHQGEESRYTYNALNILTRHNETDFVVDYTSFVPTNLMEYNSDGIIKRHIYGNSLSRISTTLTNATQTETFFIQNDRLGSGRFATNATGARVAHTTLDEWGKPLEKAMPTFAGRQADILNTFTNHTWDETLALYVTPARFYDPDKKRFISPDPHWNAHNRIFGDNPNNNLVPCIYSIRQAGNLYVYALNNPIVYVDADGKLVWNIVFGATTSALINVVEQGVTKGWDNISVAEVAANAVGGAVGSLVGAYLPDPIGNIVSEVVSHVVTDVIVSYMQKHECEPVQAISTRDEPPYVQPPTPMPAPSPTPQPTPTPTLPPRPTPTPAIPIVKDNSSNKSITIDGIEYTQRIIDITYADGRRVYEEKERVRVRQP